MILYPGGRECVNRSLTTVTMRRTRLEGGEIRGREGGVGREKRSGGWGDSACLKIVPLREGRRKTVGGDRG